MPHRVYQLVLTSFVLTTLLGFFTGNLYVFMVAVVIGIIIMVDR